MKDVRSQDVSVVFQGAIQRPDAENGGVSTALCLKRTREALPGCEIVVSTWEEDPELRALADVYVVNEDPGSLTPPQAGRNYFTNVNRQIVSTLGGLRAARKPYAVKIRTDSALGHGGFLKACRVGCGTRHSSRVFAERILICAYNTVLPSVWPGLLYFSDLFQFGRREDLIQFWSAELAPAALASAYANAPTAWWRGGEGDRPEKMAAEQYLVSCLLARAGRAIPLSGMLSSNVRDFVRSECFFAANFVALPTGEIGLELPERLREYDHARHFCYRRDYKLAEWGGRHPHLWKMLTLARAPLFIASGLRARAKFMLRPLKKKFSRKGP
jgi:hypothetical protein